MSTINFILESCFQNECISTSFLTKKCKKINYYIVTCFGTEKFISIWLDFFLFEEIRVIVCWEHMKKYMILFCTFLVKIHFGMSDRTVICDVFSRLRKDDNLFNKTDNTPMYLLTACMWIEIFIYLKWEVLHHFIINWSYIGGVIKHFL